MSRSAVPSSNSAITAAQLAELHRLGAQLDLGVQAAEIDEVGGRRPEAGD